MTGRPLRSMKTLAISAALTAAVGCGASAHAQSFPSRPVTIVVPYGAGGPADTLARIMAERMRSSLGRTLVSSAEAAIGCQ